MNTAAVYDQEPGVVSRRIAGETILVPVARRAQEMGLFTLNEVATFVWERLDGRSSVGSISEQVVASFEVDPPEAVRDVSGFVELLVQVGCAREASGESGPRPIEGAAS